MVIAPEKRKKTIHVFIWYMDSPWTNLSIFSSWIFRMFKKNYHGLKQTLSNAQQTSFDYKAIVVPLVRKFCFEVFDFKLGNGKYQNASIPNQIAIVGSIFNSRNFRIEQELKFVHDQYGLNLFLSNLYMFRGHITQNEWISSRFST